MLVSCLLKVPFHHCYDRYLRYVFTEVPVLGTDSEREEGKWSAPGFQWKLRRPPPTFKLVSHSRPEVQAQLSQVPTDPQPSNECCHNHMGKNTYLTVWTHPRHPPNARANGTLHQCLGSMILCSIGVIMTKCRPSQENPGQMALLARQCKVSSNPMIPLRSTLQPPRTLAAVSAISTSHQLASNLDSPPDLQLNLRTNSDSCST